MTFISDWQLTRTVGKWLAAATCAVAMIVAAGQAAPAVAQEGEYFGEQEDEWFESDWWQDDYGQEGYFDYEEEGLTGGFGAGYNDYGYDSDWFYTDDWYEDSTAFDEWY